MATPIAAPPAAGRDPARGAAGGEPSVPPSPGRWADEAGSQAVEYAMVGGVSAAACTALAYLLRNPETILPFITAVVRSLTNVADRIPSWG